MSSGSMPVRVSTALIAVAARSSTGTSRRLPPNVPTGVRIGATIAARRLVMVLLLQGGPVVGMSDGQHPLTPLRQRQAAQVSYSILGHNHPSIGTGLTHGAA